MKNNFYRSTFNTNVLLIKIAMTSLSLVLTISFITKSAPPFLHEIVEALMIINMFALCIIGTSITIFSSLIIFETINRFANDSIDNYVKSISQTFQIRNFLKQIQPSDIAYLTGKNGLIKTKNPIIQQFNKTIKRSIVDIRHDKILVDIPVPKEQQTVKLLTNMITDIRENLTNINKDYYFSNPKRVRNHLYFEGTRR
ncbi:TPA: hypothetical protein TUM56_001061 [Streptococcus equi subsp. zooepidemicus]|uniref:hypothetical protein n=1 Tax=Streptococcus equi TaxID=1336 RepID=UPI001E5CBBF0|nr:hypothetical protein [Streptococcus equi]MCD3370123.1 hypothetical protein [Streptococcus equi subsp. zooepidemicus]MCD3380126.1 hypothetical protein [Streptococcus equi subsp. zooepidemicus]HEL0007758.1 hypothetical protein [Streptococcus equi subsp. zooepidemicus]HEL0114903.1 hypothetical protein [Streptococcus equi subsp. zooepidemicus]HEL0116940.1 hypothetical protein [Streptococcus equi subsp. zooepidemicus]